MSDPVKLAIIYYSSTGTVDAMARHAATMAEKAGAEVRLRHVEELAPDDVVATQDEWVEHRKAVADEPTAVPDDVVWADAVLFGTPTRFGNVASQLKQFIDTLGPQWAQGQLADKVYSGFTSTSTAHGGQESTLLALYNTFHHFGGITVTPGYTDPIQFTTGNPYGPSHVDGQGSIPISEETRQATQYAGQRIATVTRQIVAGRAEVAAL